MCNLLIPDFISHVAIIIIFCCGILVCYKYSNLGRLKKKQPLSLDIQLKVLKMAKSRMIEAPHTYFLCGCISRALYDYNLDDICQQNPIPVFCRKNAILYGNARNNSGLYWWPLTLAGKENRIKFLDWCIRRVELQIKYETQKNKRFYRKWFK